MNVSGQKIDLQSNVIKEKHIIMRMVGDIIKPYQVLLQ